MRNPAPAFPRHSRGGEACDDQKLSEIATGLDPRPITVSFVSDCEIFRLPRKNQTQGGANSAGCLEYCNLGRVNFIR